jgi:plastocyanin
MRPSHGRLRILITVFPPPARCERYARMHSRRVMAVLLAAPLLLTTACGDAKRQLPNANLAKPVSLAPVQPTINPAPPSTAAPTKAPASSSAAASSAGDSSPAAPGAANEIKAVIESKFVPDTLEVKAGTEVTFVDAGGVHSVTGGTDAPDPTSPIGNHPLNAEGDSVKVVFDKPGTYPFFCIPHQSLGMKGQIVVS